MIKRIVADVIIFSAIIVIGLQVDAVRRKVSMPRELDVSPVTYSQLVPEKTEYSPGDLITFQYERTARLVGGEPLLMLTVDSFENLDTGEIFAGTFGSRIVRQVGPTYLRATRRLPMEATPGTYSFEGWASIQGVNVIRAVPYSSQKFTIKPKI